jgi:hypothetical protein
MPLAPTIYSICFSFTMLKLLLATACFVTGGWAQFGSQDCGNLDASLTLFLNTVSFVSLFDTFSPTETNKEIRDPLKQIVSLGHL